MRRYRGAGGLDAVASLPSVADNHVSYDACQPLGVRWVEPVLQGTNPVVVHPNALGEAQMAAQAMAVACTRRRRAA